MGFPVARAIFSFRLCGAKIVPDPRNFNVVVNLTPICTIGTLDSHGGHAVKGSPTVMANRLPICRVGDINDVCWWIWPHHHYSQPIVKGDYNVFSS